MGLFAEYQPIYADQGITTFPVVIENGQKKPAIKNYRNLGPAGSTKLRDQFIEADALGFVAGPKNGVTTIDVDTSSERVLADMLARCGESPFIVRTPSGGYHALYQNSGEDRRIKPWDGIPVDVLGGGLVVAAPSLVPGGGGYEIIQGSFEDLARLPRVRGLDDLKLAEDSSRKIPHGKRNTTLLRYLLRQAHHCPDLDSLIDMAMTYRDQSCELARSKGSVHRGRGRQDGELGLALPHQRTEQMPSLWP